MKLYKGVIEKENQLETEYLIDLVGDVKFDDETTRAFKEIYRYLVTNSSDIVKNGF
jgi:hypothetical protein